MLCKKCKKELPDEVAYCCFCGIRQTPPPHKSKTRGNGTGSVVKLPNGKWKAVITLGYAREPDGRVRRQTAVKRCSKKSEAILALEELRHRLDRPDHAEDISVEAIHNLFLQSPDFTQLSKSQQEALGIAWRRCQALYTIPIDELSVAQMQDVIDTQVSSYYPARDIKVLLSHLYKTAKKRELLTYNKTENLDLPPLKKSTKDAFTDAEVQAFWDDYNAGNRFTAYILIMIYTGMRYGELAAVQVSDIHLKDQYLIGGIKSEAGRNRVIPFGSKLAPVIGALMQSPGNRLLKMGENTFYTRYWETIDRVGVRKLNPHCCRHTWFTRMAAAGVQPALVAAAGGHADINVAYKNYTHAQTKKLVEIAEKI